MTKWGILSTGLIANDFCKAIQLADGELYAVASRGLTRAEEFGKLRGFKRCYGSYEELVKDPAVDVVYVATPHSHHFDAIVLCLQAGKHVLCEKPLCWNVAQTRRAVELARAKGLFLMEAMWTRFFPTTIAAKKAVKDGSLGEVLSLDASMGFLLQGDAPRLTQKQLAGGATLDVGVYAVSWAVMMLGAPEKIHAVGALSARGVDESVSAMLTYNGGRTTAQLQCGFVGALRNEAAVNGTQGRLVVGAPFGCPSSLVVTTQSKEAPHPLLLTGDSEATTRPLDPPYPASPGYNFIGSQGMVHEVRAVHEALAKGWTEHPLMPLSETLIVAEVMAEILRQVGVQYDVPETQAPKL